MTQKPKVLCSICARGGSKGVPGKNIRNINGKPLIAHSIEQARISNLFDHIVVSSDCDEILNTALSAGIDFALKRPCELATDTAGKLGAIQHCAEEAQKRFNVKYDYFFDLDCTSPLRSVEDLISVYKLLLQNGTTNVITGTPSHRSPYFNMVEVIDGEVCLVKKTDVKRRQDAPVTYDMNASIYAWTNKALFEQNSLFEKGTKIHVMPPERSHDIDSELDFKLVEFLMQLKGN